MIVTYGEFIALGGPVGIDVIPEVQMNPELKRRWIEALRSGKYIQGRDKLLSEDGQRYCCLGVLCKVQGESEEAWGNHSYPPEYLRAGLPKPTLLKLAAMNDGTVGYFLDGGHRRTFAEIADWIEANL